MFIERQKKKKKKKETVPIPSKKKRKEGREDIPPKLKATSWQQGKGGRENFTFLSIRGGEKGGFLFWGGGKTRVWGRGGVFFGKRKGRSFFS